MTDTVQQSQNAFLKSKQLLPFGCVRQENQKWRVLAEVSFADTLCHVLLFLLIFAFDTPGIDMMPQQTQPVSTLSS